MDCSNRNTFYFCFVKTQKVFIKQKWKIKYFRYFKMVTWYQTGVRTLLGRSMWRNLNTKIQHPEIKWILFINELKVNKYQINPFLRVIPQHSYCKLPILLLAYKLNFHQNFLTNSNFEANSYCVIRLLIKPFLGHPGQWHYTKQPFIILFLSLLYFVTFVKTKLKNI